ncbi:MAG: FkbM family methyltransferase [Nostoc sp.]|uniref:FkbM family methyltransferase n=1 Tax=Nostoc sp. TaxID=1180 RepID=UPI002FF8E1EF
MVNIAEKIKDQLKTILKETDLYDKYYQRSSFHNLYISLFRHDLVERNEKAFKFIKSILEPDSVVFDIGANIGYKAVIYSKIGCKVIAVEPDPRNIKILQRVFNNNKKVTLVEKAVSSQIGVEKIYISEQDSALTTFSTKWKSFLESQKDRDDLAQFSPSVESYEIPTTTLDALIEQFGVPRYIKIDVEGYELEAVKGLSQPIKLISLEANLPEFREETIKSVLHLFEIENKALFNYVLDDTKSFERNTWLDYEGITDFLKTTDIRYMEIYCKME